MDEVLSLFSRELAPFPGDVLRPQGPQGQGKGLGMHRRRVHHTSQCSSEEADGGPASSPLLKGQTKTRAIACLRKSVGYGYWRSMSQKPDNKQQVRTDGKCALMLLDAESVCHQVGLETRPFLVTWNSAGKTESREDRKMVPFHLHTVA